MRVSAVQLYLPYPSAQMPGAAGAPIGLILCSASASLSLNTAVTHTHVCPAACQVTLTGFQVRLPSRHLPCDVPYTSACMQARARCLYNNSQAQVGKVPYTPLQDDLRLHLLCFTALDRCVSAHESARLRTQGDLRLHLLEVMEALGVRVQKAMAPATITHVIAVDLDDASSEKLKIARQHQCGSPIWCLFTGRLCQWCPSWHAPHQCPATLGYCTHACSPATVDAGMQASQTYLHYVHAEPWRGRLCPMR